MEGVDDETAKRLAEALEAAANPKPKSPDRAPVDTPEARHKLFGDPKSPFRAAQERKRTYLAREDGRSAAETLGRRAEQVRGNGPRP